MKYKDPETGEFKSIGVKAIGPQALNSKSNSTENTYSCDYINKLHEYSTTERIIGTWVDGKPLYRKNLILDKSQLVSGSHDYLHNISNIDIITFAEGLVLRASGTTDSIPWESNNENWRTCINDRTRSYIGLYLGETLIANCTSIVLTLEYTKTTD